MTIFGKILIGLMLATAAVLIIKGDGKKEIAPVETNVTTDAENQIPETAVTDGQFNGSLADLAARGGDYQCSFTETNDGSDSTGTVYISGKKLHGDFSTSVKTPAVMTVESHMISDGGFVYSWSSMMPTGFKIAVTENSNTTSTPNSQGFDYHQKLDYKCSAWTVDESKFAVPADVKFTEIKS